MGLFFRKYSLPPSLGAQHMFLVHRCKGVSFTLAKGICAKVMYLFQNEALKNSKFHLALWCPCYLPWE